MSKPLLAGKRAVVTGASSGIGRATALALAEAGADVMVHARQSAAAAHETAAAIAALGRQSHVLLADLADAQALDSFAAEAWQHWDGVDIWVNNAGVDVLTGDAAQWPFDRKLHALWQVDVLATIALSRSIGAWMRAGSGGAIVNIGWDQAEHGMGGNSGEIFGTVKGAVMAFTRSAAASLAPEVRVNCVAPGWIRTAWGHQASEAWQRRAVEESLLRRWGTPEDVAAAIVYLASPAAGFITGHILPVNGGLAIRGEPEPKRTDHPQPPRAK